MAVKGKSQARETIEGMQALAEMLKMLNEAKAVLSAQLVKTAGHSHKPGSGEANLAVLTAIGEMSEMSEDDLCSMALAGLVALSVLHMDPKKKVADVFPDLKPATEPPPA